jgi:hypothetical protein
MIRSSGPEYVSGSVIQNYRLESAILEIRVSDPGSMIISESCIGD